MINHPKHPLNRTTTTVAAVQRSLSTHGYSFSSGLTGERLAHLLCGLSVKSVMYAQESGNCLAFYFRSDSLSAKFKGILHRLSELLACTDLTYLLYAQKSTKVTQPPNEVYLYLRKPTGQITSHDPFGYYEHPDTSHMTYPPTKFESFPLYRELGAFDSSESPMRYVIIGTRGSGTTVTQVWPLRDS